MAINLSDLPPKYQQQAMEKYRKQQTRRGPMPSAADVQDPGKPMKYRNNPTERVTSSGAVIRFDSQKEARRYDHLILRQQAGEIRDLRLQVDFYFARGIHEPGGAEDPRYQIQGGFYIQGAGRAPGGGGCEKPANQDTGVPDQTKADERSAWN